MTKLTDVQICKRIAEIEGLETSADGSHIIDRVHCFSFSPTFASTAAKVFCFDLMVKHHIQFLITPTGDFRANWTPTMGIDDPNPQRAILLAIIAKKDSEK